MTRIRFGLAVVEQKMTLAILRRACDFIVAGNEMTKRELEVRLPGKPIFILPAGFDAGFGLGFGLLAGLCARLAPSGTQRT